MQTIQFMLEGEIITGRILSRDADPTVALWVVDVANADRDFLVMPEAIIAPSVQVLG